MNKFLPDPLKPSNVIMSLTEINCYRKIYLSDAEIYGQNKEKLQTLCDNYSDIFSKHLMDIGKMDLMQMTCKPKTDIKPSITFNLLS